MFTWSDVHQNAHLTCCEIHKCRAIDVAQLRELSSSVMDTDNSDENSLYELIGGDAALRLLVDRF